MEIIGAGLAGLIASNIFPRARIIEAQGRDKLEHKALLRFGSTAVADATGIEFRKVKVHKGVWHIDKFDAPSIQLANLYSKKVIGKLADRSIWNLDPAERYIAPEDFISMLIDNASGRIAWNTPFDLKAKDRITISTMPMPVLADALGLAVGGGFPKFEHKAIQVLRFKIHNADVFQTIYFTNPDNAVYRASITGDMLIVEAVEGAVDTEEVLRAFGLAFMEIDLISSTGQKFGKIAPIDDAWRRNFILRASVDHGIYSAGRFACWRNILLDDVVHDLSVIKRLIKLGDGYFNNKEA